MQGSGIHHYDKAARQYLMRFSAENANQMLAEVGNRVRVEGSVYDLFISHATDDKDSLVRPLAESLRDLGLKIWYDEFELRPGDSIRSSIDRGIATSSNGLVVMSPAFISKSWTQWELNGLVGRLLNGEFKLLPMWHDISRAQVESFSPSLADVIAIVTAHKPIGQIARELVSALE